MRIIARVGAMCVLKAVGAGNLAALCDLGVFV